MKGIILAGGNGTRLRPITHAINKQLIPVYDKPMIFYPLLTLRESGIDEILIVSHRYSLGQFIDILGRGEDLNMKISYTVQPAPLGLAHGLSMGEPFARGEKVALIFGDNIFSDSFRPAIETFKDVERGAMVALYEESNLVHVKRSGVAEIEGDSIVNIEEKPPRPKSNWIVAGFALYDHRVFDFIRQLKPSARGELEFTDLNNLYIKEGTMGYFKVTGQWLDAGTFDTLLAASNFVAGLKNRPGRPHHFAAPLELKPKKELAEARYS